MVETHVLVFGPGKLGLGLIGVQAAAGGHPLSLVGRTTQSAVSKALQAQGAYEAILSGYGGNSSRRVHQVSRHFYSSEHPRSSKALIDFIARTERVIFISTAKAGQADAVRIVDGALGARPRNFGFFAFVPGENTVHPEIRYLASRRTASNHFYYCPSMVDRICRKVIFDKRGSRVHVLAEQDFEFAVHVPEVRKRAEQRERDALVEALRAMDVSVVGTHDELETIKARKRMMVNTPLLAAAIYAAELECPTLGALYTMQGDDGSGADLMTEIVRLCSFALSIQQEGLPESAINEYREWYLKRLLANGDEEISRLLERLQQATAVPLLNELADRLGEVYDLLVKVGNETGVIGQALKMLLERKAQQIH